jgi:lysozyme
MNIEQFRDELKRDEGVKNEIYLDHLGLPTCGIGHLITEWDNEYGQEVGTPVAEERVNELFEKDLSTTVDECKLIYNDFDDLPVKAQHIIANMMFNMGRPRLSRFHKMKKAIDNRDWFEAAYEMTDSKWAKQVPNRAMRLVDEMKSVGEST